MDEGPCVVAFEGVAELIDRLPVDGDGGLLAQWVQLWDRVEQRLCGVLGAFDASAGYLDDGLGSTVNWLAWHARMDRGEAGILTSTARRLRVLPATAAAWADGTFGSGHVRAIARALNDRTVPLFAEHEAELVPELQRLTARECAKAMRYWREFADAVLDPPPPAPQPEPSLRPSPNDLGGWSLDGRLDDETGALLDKALALAEPDEPQMVGSTRRALALKAICEFFLDHQQGSSAGRHRPHLNLNMDVDGPGGDLVDVRSGDVKLTDEAARRWACDSIVHRVVRAGSAILDYGRSTRSVPAPLWNALVLRDHGCRFPGCDRKPSWCHAHHLHHWLDGGSTNLDNLVLLCGHHHRLLHQAGWHAKLLPDATFEVTSPAGTTHESAPPHRFRFPFRAA